MYAELLQTILCLKPEQIYLMHPNFVAIRALKNLAMKERKGKMKQVFIEVLNETNSD